VYGDQYILNATCILADINQHFCVACWFTYTYSFETLVTYIYQFRQRHNSENNGVHNYRHKNCESWKRVLNYGANCPCYIISLHLYLVQPVLCGGLGYEEIVS
jgi:hypothetical protein